MLASAHARSIPNNYICQCLTCTAERNAEFLRDLKLLESGLVHLQPKIIKLLSTDNTSQVMGRVHYKQQETVCLHNIYTVQCS